MLSAKNRESSRINILFLTTSWPQSASDWRGRFILDMAMALSRSSYLNLRIFAPVGVKEIGDNVSISESKHTNFYEKLVSAGGVAHLLRREPLRGLYYALRVLWDMRLIAKSVDVDVYHVNWIQLLLGLPRDNRPALATVLGTDYALLRFPIIRFLVRRSIIGRSVIIAPNAEWMVRPLQHYFGDIALVEPIHFGVDPRLFANKRAESSRRWLLVTRITREKLGDILAWGKGKFSDERSLLLLGPKQDDCQLPGWIDYRGETNPDELLEIYFPEAVGLISLSRHDEGRPQILVEAMAAGLPVVASKIPAHMSLIQNRHTGWLVDSDREFLAALEEAEDAKYSLHIVENARRYVRSRLGGWDRYADDCVDRYRKLLSTRL